MPKKQVKQAAPLLETEQASPDQNVGETGMMPLSVTPCVRIRYGDRESKVAAQLLLARMQEEFGDEVRVVLRRNHDDENSPGVVVGLEFFGVSVQLSEPMLWSGQPADVEQKEWMDPAVERVADMLLSLAERERDVVATDGWSLDQEWDELVALGISMLISASGLALWYFIG